MTKVANLFKWVDPKTGEVLKVDGDSLVGGSGRKVPKEAGVYRFCGASSYADTFGFQWNTFPKTQYDSSRCSDLTRKRFFASCGWTPEEMARKSVLEIGCGAGRFTEIILGATNAFLCSVDYSSAVLANSAAHSNNQRLQVVQASVYELPFEEESFDYVFCFGVLQHTPDPKKTLECLARMVKGGGKIAVDFYPRSGWWTKWHAKYLFRKIVKRYENERLLKLIDKHLAWMLPLGLILLRLKIYPVFGRLLPIVDLSIYKKLKLSNKEFKQWVLLDTFDMLSPEYDQPQKASEVKNELEKNGIKIEFSGKVFYGDNLVSNVVRGIKLASK